MATKIRKSLTAELIVVAVAMTFGAVAAFNLVPGDANEVVRAVFGAWAVVLTCLAAPLAWGSFQDLRELQAR